MLRTLLLSPMRPLARAIGLRVSIYRFTLKQAWDCPQERRIFRNADPMDQKKSKYAANEVKVTIKELLESFPETERELQPFWIRLHCEW